MRRPASRFRASLDSYHDEIADILRAGGSEWMSTQEMK